MFQQNRLPEPHKTSADGNICCRSVLSDCCEWSAPAEESWESVNPPGSGRHRDHTGLVCGTHNDVADFAWTKNDALLLGDVQGPDLTTLYGWWLSLG